jgi:aminoglycoside phosphotransferase (APT) family kinase protein
MTEREPLVVLGPLQAFLDDRALGAGAVSARPIGEGHSNVTYLITRGEDRFVLRRPPRGPLPRSAHDVLREARMLAALDRAGVAVPRVLAVCDDVSVIGAPFYVMPYIDAHVLTTELPDALSGSDAPAAIGLGLTDALVDLHAIDAGPAGLSEFGRGDGYLERQLRRFSGLLEQHATRPLPQLHDVAAWLQARRPETAATTFVHGDYRLGNLMFAAEPSPRVAAILDWEMATLGDPLADLGYMTAMWADPGDEDDPMLTFSAITRLAGFPSRDRLVERYAERSGRDVSRLGWYQTLAVWKAAIFLEASYRRFIAGSTDDAYFAFLGEGVPILARRAARMAEAYH